MRQTKFKGKINTTRGRNKDAWFGRWVVGFPEIRTDTLPPWNVRMNPIGESCLYSFTVDPKTICEYTGVNDKNGKDIYEHDLLEIEGKVYEVIANDLGGWKLHSEKGNDVYPFSPIVPVLSKVIGNKYDTYEPIVYGKNEANLEEDRDAVNEIYKDVQYYMWQELPCDNETKETEGDEPEI